MVKARREVIEERYKQALDIAKEGLPQLQQQAKSIMVINGNMRLIV